MPRGTRLAISGRHGLSRIHAAHHDGMMRRRLGSSGFTISVVGVGTFAAGGWMWGTQDDADSLAALHAALDAGATWIDTAPIYGSGRADRVVGRLLRELPAERRPLV